METLISSPLERFTCPQQKDVSLNTKYLKENVAIFDTRAISVLSGQHVRELYLLNLGGIKNKMPAQVDLNGTTFLDNGEVNDLVPGDGIYTSTETFNNNEVTFSTGENVRSLLEKPIVSPEFNQYDRLRSEFKNYSLRTNDGPTVSGIFEITCDIEFGTNDCYAAQWGICSNCCMTIYSDNFTVTFGF